MNPADPAQLPLFLAAIDDGKSATGPAMDGADFFGLGIALLVVVGLVYWAWRESRL